MEERHELCAIDVSNVYTRWLCVNAVLTLAPAHDLAEQLPVAYPSQACLAARCGLLCSVHSDL
jgi:hypothetical protein